MRVCHVVFSHFPDPGTTAPQYSAHLAAQGIRIDLLALSFSPSETLEEHQDGVRVFRVPAYVEGRPFATLRKFSGALASMLRKQHYDLVHIYASREAAYVRLRCQRPRTKWLLHVISGSLKGGLRTEMNNKLTRLTSHFFDMVVAEKLVGRKVLGHRPFAEVPVGADFSRFVPGSNERLRTQLDYSQEDIVAVYLGTFAFSRKIDRLILGFAIASQQCSKLRLLLVGGGAQLPDVKALVAELGLTDKVYFVGEVPFLEVPEYVAIADIGLGYVPITPEYDPQSPLKTVEFMAAGKPVLATATQGNALFIQDGENGLLVNDDSPSLGEGILRLARHPALRKKLARNARPSVSEYDWKRIVREQLLPVYKQLVEGTD